MKLTKAAVGALRRHRELQLKERQRLAGLCQEHGLVFTTRVGTPLSCHNLITRYLKPLLKHMGLPQIRFHDLPYLRNAYAFWGIHPKVVQELLEHASIIVTLDTHARFSCGEDRLDALVKRVTVRLQ